MQSILSNLKPIIQVLTKEDGEKCFGVSLIFYEEVKDINICHAVHTLQKMYTTEVEVVGGASSIRRTRNESKRPRSAQKPGTTERSRYTQCGNCRIFLSLKFS